MQVVYSGGTSTPTPSPHLQRKNLGFGPGAGSAGGGGAAGYSRPVMPGYTVGHPPPATLQRPARDSKLTEGDVSLRDSIPAMRRPVAVVCLVLNVLLPGLGTFVSGMTVLCGSHVRPGGGSRRGVVWTNTGVALLQFGLTFLLLLGWIWSIMWGTAFLSISKEYYKKEQQPEQTSSTQGRHKPSPTPKRDHHDDDHATSRHPSPSPSVSSPGDPPPGHAPSRSEQPHPQRNGLSVNVVGGTLPSGPDFYNTPSTSSERAQPIIVLQEAPVIVNHSEVTSETSGTLMNARTRHEKILRRQMSDNELSPFILTHERLEAIVIHDAPVQQRGTGRPQPYPDEAMARAAPVPKS